MYDTEYGTPVSAPHAHTVKYYQVEFIDRETGETRKYADATTARIVEGTLLIKRDSYTWIHPLDTIKDVTIFKSTQPVKP